MSDVGDSIMSLTQHDYEFWEMALSAPATISIAGVLAGSIVTAIIAIMTNLFTSRQKHAEWERNEKSRKEDRFFNLKHDAYLVLFSETAKTENLWEESENLDKSNIKQIRKFIEKFIQITDNYLDKVYLYCPNEICITILNIKNELGTIKMLLIDCEKILQEKNLTFEDTDTLAPEEIPIELKDLGEKLFKSFIAIIKETTTLKGQIRQDISSHHR